MTLWLLPWPGILTQGRAGEDFLWASPLQSEKALPCLSWLSSILPSFLSLENDCFQGKMFAWRCLISVLTDISDMVPASALSTVQKLSFHSNDDLRKQVLWSFPFYSWGKRLTESKGHTSSPPACSWQERGLTSRQPASQSPCFQHSINLTFNCKSLPSLNWIASLKQVFD